MEGCKFGLFVILLQIGRALSEEAEVCQPGFTSQNYTFSVHRRELEPGTKLGKVSFADCPESSHALYSAGESRFHVQRDGTVVIKCRVRMHRHVFSFPVLAWDTQGKKYTSTIIVKSKRHAEQAGPSSTENELPVVLFPVPLSGLSRKKRQTWVIPPITIPENERGLYPKRLVQIKSTKDKGTKVYYRVTGEGADQSPEGLFTCDRNTGWLFVTKPLDREQKDQYVLSCHAVMENGMPAEEPMEIIIKVTDQNDNSPKFTKALFKGAVAEGAMPGTSVMAITATDLDDTEMTNYGIVEYSILNQEPKEPADHMFTVNKETGDISVIASGLDRERVRLYTLTVQATDMEGAGLETTASVEIEILNINDNAPIFDPKTCDTMSASPNSPLTTHVLNTATGTPAKGLQVKLSRLDGPTQKWVELTTSSTNCDGRCPGIISPERFTAGTYKMRFETGEFWKQLEQTSFYPYVEIVFTILDPRQKFHIPLLLSPFSYTTYRGS